MQIIVLRTPEMTNTGGVFWMNRGGYCNKLTIEHMVLIDGMVRQLKALADETNEKDWKKKMKTCSTYLRTIMQQKFDSIEDYNEKQALLRRAERTVVKFFTSDQHKMSMHKGSSLDKTITVTEDDYYDLLELANQSCLRCTQGDKVAGCKWRQMWHRHGAPVAREHPADGECEYRWDNELRFVDPFTYKTIEPRKIGER